jgi:hypothetical protein
MRVTSLTIFRSDKEVANPPILVMVMVPVVQFAHRPIG